MNGWENETIFKIMLKMLTTTWVSLPLGPSPLSLFSTLLPSPLTVLCPHPARSYGTQGKGPQHTASAGLGPTQSPAGLGLWRINRSNPDESRFAQELGLEVCAADSPGLRALPEQQPRFACWGLWTAARLCHPRGLCPPTALGPPSP